MVANAQFLGSGALSGTTNCSNPLNALSPICTGSTNTPLGQTGGTMGQTGSQQTGGYVPGMYPQAPSTGTSSAVRSGGINQTAPSYSDLLNYGNGTTGAQRNPLQSGTLLPQPPTEFQQIAAGATGQMLPIFGANLFAVPSSFTPIEPAPVPADYVVGPGDELLIRVWGQVSFNARSTVDRTGNIYIPQVGNVQVAGLHFDQLDDYLKKQFGRVFRNFDLSVNMGQLRSIPVYVVGNAKRPGSYTVSSLSTLVNALFDSGGPSRAGSMRRIQFKRGGKIVTTFDLYDLLIRGDKSKDAPLLPGDVIYIPPVGPQIAVAGSVHTPAIYELKGSETVDEAIQMAGGFATSASRKEAQLERTDPYGSRQTIEVSLEGSGLSTPVRNGDILRILAMIQRFNRTVTLRGNVANPGRYRWKPGMRILDLIPNAAALETHGYWQRRIAMGLPAPAYTPAFSVYNANLPGPSQQAAAQAENSQQSFTTNTSLAGAEVQAESQQPLATAGQTTPSKTNPTGTGPTNPGAGTASQSPISGAQGPNAPPPLRYYPPGDRFSEGQFSIENDLYRIAPGIDWSYAVIQRTNPQTLATSLIPFDLGKAVLDRDPSQNLKLEPGDFVTVFSTADIQVPQAQQVKYVRLEGEVVHAGVYSVKPGETLRELVEQAGGLTPKAYLYGSEFLRESTRRLQQARLDSYIDKLQRDIELSSANAKGNLVNPIGASALGASIQSQRDLITTMRKMRASGRIVLNLTPFSRGVDALPNLPLQDGDRFIVPSMPDTVNVVGSVYDQNSFLYTRGKNIGDYLNVAGGPSRDADKRHEFVVRADGSVLSKQTAGGNLFWGGLSSKLAYPGDTIVVPANVSKTSLLRNLTDYSAVLSNFGVGVAAINLLR
jgi:protein involved in polysaccharide export with SLBB domain